MLRLLLLLNLTLFAHAITLESPLKRYDILSHAEVFIDMEGNRSIESILADPSLFRPFGKEKIELGYTTKEVWVRFDLRNGGDQILRPVLEIDNPMLDHIDLYTIEEDKVLEHQIKGVISPHPFEGALDFSFDLEIDKQSHSQYILHVRSTSSALYFHVNIMSPKAFFKEEIRHQFILALFFGLVIGLIVYNSFIYLFTKDHVYIYYIGYLFFVTWNYASYTTVLRHILPIWLFDIDTSLGLFYIIIAMSFMLLFTRSFLQLRRFRWIDRSIKTFLFIGMLILLLSLVCCYLIELGTYLVLSTSLYLITISIWLTYRREPHAEYFVIAWGTAIAGIISQAFYDIGIPSPITHCEYLYPSTIAFEAVLFSVMLARRLNHVKALANALDTQKVLTRELHHRVKNNMQLIISLLRLKFADLHIPDVQQRLQESINNIIAISKTHESLYTQKELTDLDTQEYFQQLLDGLLHSGFDHKDITFKLDARTTLPPDDALYCGIILNELVTNTTKHAFKDRDRGMVSITLYEEEGYLHFKIADDGIGYDLKSTKEGFGLMMLHALVKGELHGIVDTLHDHGAAYHIIWKKKEAHLPAFHTN